MGMGNEVSEKLHVGVLSMGMGSQVSEKLHVGILSMGMDIWVSEGPEALAARAVWV